MSVATIASLFVTLAMLVISPDAGAQGDRSARMSRDPRRGLGGGVTDAGEAMHNLGLVSHSPKAAGFFDPGAPENFSFANTDMAFSGKYMFQGNYHGLLVWDMSNPNSPAIRTTVVCPGGGADVSVYKHLLFVSVEEQRSRIDCGTQGVADTVSAERFRGVRIFDVSDIDHPRQVAAVQTCRGSHTHTLVTDPNDTTTIYVYVSGTTVVRSPNELAGCSGKRPAEDPGTALFRIDIIRVPLGSPQESKVIRSPRIFADSSGAIAGLWKGGDHGPGTQATAETDQCHDFTVYAALGLAAGACSGNGLLLDIRDPANPKRVTEVSDPNFAYWHSATFSNDGSKVIFTDEWGYGSQPRCRETDPPEWGADAIFTLADGRLHRGAYFKIPAPQTSEENCVPHNGSLIPVPGRDIMVQGWYQGGLSVFDFTDPNRPIEIAYFDRGPTDSTKLTIGGHWAAYWYNGYIIASEIIRGLDVLELTASEHLSQNEIDAAKLVRLDEFNAQYQQRMVWPASFVVARAYLDQLTRNRGVDRARSQRITRELDRAEKATGERRRSLLMNLAGQLDRDFPKAADSARVRALAVAVRRLVGKSD